jgi:hypothetical protein
LVSNLAAETGSASGSTKTAAGSPDIGKHSVNVLPAPRWALVAASCGPPARGLAAPAGPSEPFLKLFRTLH